METQLSDSFTMLTHSVNRRLALIVISCAVLPCLAALTSYAGFRIGLMSIYVLLGLASFVVTFKGTEERKDFVFMLVILSVSLSLLLSSALVSGNLCGYDIHDEYYQFSQVAEHGWNAGSSDLYNSVLSVTILPTFISIFSGLDGFSIFIIVFPLIYSMVPLLLYVIYRKIVSPNAAFLGVFLFMSYPTFFNEMISLGRQEIAEFLMLLLLLVFLTRELSVSTSGKLVIISLVLGTVMSHYSLAFIFLTMLAVSFIASRAERRTRSLSSIGLLLIALVVTLARYTSVAGGVGAGRLSQVIQLVMGGMNGDLFNLGSRPSVVEYAATFGGSPGLLHSINRLTQYVVQLSLLIGFIVFAFKKIKTAAEKEIFPFMVGGMMLVVAAVALPFFASLLNFSRTYHLALLFIAPCFYYGVNAFCSVCSSFAAFLNKGKLPHVRLTGVWRPALAAAILLSYLLFVSGWAWAATNDLPTSFVLDSQRMLQSPDIVFKQTYYADFTVSTDIAGARWLLRFAPAQYPLCSDELSRFHVLNSYGERPLAGDNAVSELPDQCANPSFFYLNEYNTLYGTGLAWWNTQNGQVSEFSMARVNFMNMTRIYSDGSTVYIN